VLARDQVEIGLAENGGNPTQAGCAFHVKGLASAWRTEARKGHWYPTFIRCTVHSAQPLGGAEQVKRISRVRQRLVRKMLSYLPAPIAALNLSRWNSSLSK
jgi:hypothetical protein